MDKISIKLNSKKSFTSTNINNDIVLQLDTCQNKVPKSIVDYTLDRYEQYFKEKDESNKYRLIFTIKPLCTNILYNHETEVIYKEGSNECINFTNESDILKFTGVTDNKNYKHYINKIKGFKLSGSTYNFVPIDYKTRDTAISHSDLGDFEYKCGIDIFNNHLLRKKEFVVVNKTNHEEKNFNTIYDSLRTYDGDNEIGVTMKSGKDDDVSNDFHIYNTDNINTFYGAIKNNLVEKNGWFGFYNPSLLRVPNVIVNNKEYIVNRTINNKRECDFIDLYPDRTLFSFVPKWNPYRNRAEYNWKYCLTYPYANDERHPIIYEGGISGIYGKIYIDDVYNENDNKFQFGLTQIRIVTNLSHTLNINNNVLLTIFDNNGNLIEDIPYEINVVNIGNNGYNTTNFFSVYFSDIEFYVKKYKNIDFHFRVRKISDNGTPCKYYVRKHRPIPNFKNTQYEQTEDLDEKTIQWLIKNNRFDSTINKLAFSKTIYNDDVAQIIVTDDVNITGLRDNLGRELSEIFLTIVKNNSGHNEWYKENNFTGDTVEYSHCFGPLSSGYELYHQAYDYNVHRIHNINQPEMFNVSPNHMTTGVTINGDNTENGTYNVNNEFYGDIIEFYENTLEEVVIEPLYYRFNTAQREYDSISNNPYQKLYFDEIISDDFGNPGFIGVTNNLTNVCGISTFCENLSPEGYYYKSHYGIKIREFETEVNEGYHTLINYTLINSGITGGTTEFSINTNENYFFNVSDEVYFFNLQTNKYEIGNITKVSSEDFCKLNIVINKIITNITKNYVLFKPNILKPSTAYETYDGTGRYIWRNIKKNKDIERSSELYDSVFTNGAHYFEKDINFYLKRQDPLGMFNLLPKPECVLNIYNKIEFGGNYKDVSYADYYEENNGLNC